MQKTSHRTIEVEGLRIFYREAGRRGAPAVLLLHGFPSSSHTFRHLMEPLAEVAHVVAPDLPGFGFSDAPEPGTYEYGFANIARTIEAFTRALGLDRFFLYVHDFGAPVAYHLATGHPARVRGLVVQNGNAHDEGLGPAWDAARAWWAAPTPENRASLPDWLNFEGTRDQYIGGIPERLVPLFPPECWHLDWERMSRPGNVEIQFALFSDYRNHVARFAEIAAYHRDHQPPCLLLWGRHDVFFQLEEVLAYARALERIEMHVWDGTHFLLETHHRECAAAMASFIHEEAYRAP